jgi:phage tail protein X
MSSPQFINHISSDGDRWDLLAWKFYGDPTLFGPIVMANPLIPIEPVLSAGLTVVVPVLQKASVVTADLPPWKQSNS